MNLWALFSAYSDRNGKVESWAQDPIRGDDNLGNMGVNEAADWALNEIPEDASNAVIVSDDGTIVKWIMNSPAGKPRKWW